MLFFNLEPFEFLEGFLSLIWVIFATIIGIMIIIKTRKKEYITVGLFWILLCGGWWASSIQFITIISVDYRLTDSIYLMLTMLAIPWGVICWLISFGNFVYPEKKKKIVYINLVIIIIYQSLFLIFAFIKTDWVGTRDAGTYFNTKFSPFSLIFIIYGMSLILITGIIFSWKSMKMDDPKIKWKGRFLLIAFVLYSGGAIVDSAINLSDPTIGSIITVLVRIVLVTSAILFYFAFFLPESIANRLIKKNK
ncbi:MAG: hypothetical protein KGD57_03385 [Candidatus Lokiarchaeota archaeon]|nr:hypothetical protein [Candidatus Lokiarchaeota archaeon]